MRSYILTERERKTLERHVETGEKLDGFTVLVHHLKKHRDTINEDLELVEASLRKIFSDRPKEVADGLFSGRKRGRKQGKSMIDR